MTRKKNRILILSNFLPRLLPTLFAICIGLAGSSARADGNASAASLHLTNLTPAAGKYINVFFVQASEALLVFKKLRATDTENTPPELLPETQTGQQLEFGEIMMPPLRKQIPANGIVDFEHIRVPKHYVNGIAKTYTHIFVAITEALPNPLYLRNHNGTQSNGMPKPIIDPRLSADQLARLPDADFQVVSSGFISKFSLPKHTDNGVTTLDALVDLSQ